MFAWKRLLFWPLLCLLAIAALWTAIWVQALADQRQLERTSLREAQNYAQSYEHFLNRSISQMDHISMQLKYDWEQSKGRFAIAELVRQGMFSDAAFVSLSIYDQRGVLRTSSRAGGIAPSVAGAASFAFHKNNISTALRIELAGPDSLQFTRRLDAEDDAFDGMVLMRVDAGYFSSFYESKSFGKLGMVAMQIESSGASVASAPNTLPLLASLGPTGAKEFGAALFGDAQARVMGWQTSRAYPVTAVVGLARREMAAGIEASQKERWIAALIGTILLAAFGLAATMFTQRLILRAREEDAIRTAYRTATDHANDGFFMVRPLMDGRAHISDFEIMDCNERGASFYDLSRAELLGMSLSELHQHNEHYFQSLVAAYKQALESGFHQQDVHMPRDSRIRIEWVQRTLVPAGSGLAVTLHDVTRQKRHEVELMKLANEDTLTALPNRYWLLNYLPRVLDGANQLALLFIDLDGFKHVNDTQGHAVGDALLKESAERLKKLLRPSDHVVRFGGDEFIVLLEPLESKDAAALVASRILKSLGTPFQLGGEVQSIGASIGISCYPDDGADAETLIKHGDIAMYSGKTDGKGQYRFYHPALFEQIKSRNQTKLELIEALDQDQFMLYYQPRVDTLSGRLCSMEALVRWLHPQRGLIPPLEFIPQAEANGLLLRLGEVVMDKACRQQAAWAAAGLELVPVSVNVSPTQFSQGQVHRQLALCLERHRVAPSLLEVEITESAMMGDQAEVLTQLKGLRDLGIKLHIDDFGTGYSSLWQLQRLQMDVLKVDRAFTTELGKSADGKVFFQAIVSMAHALGMRVVAEGVETQQQLDILRSLRCDEVQGYLFARPLPPRDIAGMLASRLPLAA